MLHVFFLLDIAAFIIFSLIMIKLPSMRVSDDPLPQNDAGVLSKPAKKFFGNDLNIIIISLLIMIINTACTFFNLGIYDRVPVFVSVVLFIETAVFVLRRIFGCRSLFFLGAAVLAAALLELTLFQFPSYRFLGGYGKKHTLSPLEANITGGGSVIDDHDGSITVKGRDYAALTFENVDWEINSIKINAKMSDGTLRYDAAIDITDETSSEYRMNIAHTTLIKKNDDTFYIPCQFSGKVSSLRVKFSALDDNGSLVVSDISLNEPIPFSISYLRFGAIVLLVMIVCTAAYTPAFNRSFSESKYLCLVMTFLATAAFIGAAFFLIMSKMSNEDILNEWKLNEGNQITQELVDAFEHRQISLLEKPSGSLLDLNDPYDWTERRQANADYLWDHVLYNGKYYSYYGIAPVILLFLPYHLITGHYFSTAFAVLIFSVIGIIFLAMTYFAVIRRWFGSLSAGCVWAGLIIILSSCGIWFCTGRPLFYEISISSGFAFVCASAYFLISSETLSKGKKLSLTKTALASLFSGIAVLCRPTLAVYSICMVIFFITGIPKAAYIPNEEQLIKKPRRRIAYLACAAFPLMTLAAVQMWYNMARFGSPLDFGIKYSLTINDFIHSQYHTHFVLIGLYNYLFAMPSFSLDYPFISTPFSDLDVNGYYFHDVGNTSGIFFLALPVFAYLLAFRALKKLPDRKTRARQMLIALPCVIMPLAIMFSIWESGYAVRYTADFSWQIIMGAFTILFCLYCNTDSTKKSFIRKFLAFSAVYAIITNGMQIFDFSFDRNVFPMMTGNLEDLIKFWK